MSTPNTHLGANEIKSIMKSAIGSEIFFLGAGGIMMSSLALLTKKAGYSVKGSDRSRSALTEKLEESGIEVFYTHCAENLGECCGALVYTVAVSPDNPEYARAQREGIPCISRADYLGYIMTEYKNRIGIAGMHGKSTCTSMCAQIFLTAAGRGNVSDPTVVSGAVYAAMDGAYHIGESDNFIFEACEYMDSFLDFNPTVAVLLNEEIEHVDYFKSIEQIRESFRRYGAIVGREGTVIYNADDENTVISADGIDARKIGFGLSDKAYIRAVNIEVGRYPIEFDIEVGGESYAHVRLPAFGLHSVYNALAAAASAMVSGIGREDIVEGLAEFKGAGRRMEYKGLVGGAAVYDDYGHHPTEVAATLTGAKNICRGRLICAFQPHTYSRTAALKEEFVAAFAEADKVIFADIYAAREENIYGISSEKLAETVGEKAICGGSLENVARLIMDTAEAGDTVIVMGAGDIFKVFPMMGL